MFGKRKEKKIVWVLSGEIIVPFNFMWIGSWKLGFPINTLDFGNFRLDRQDIHFREINCIQKLAAVSACQRKTDFIQLPRYSEIES